MFMLFVKENLSETDVSEDRRHNDEMLVLTPVSEHVESVIKTENLLIIAGHMECEKTSIVQHIALKYRKNAGCKTRGCD